MKKRPAVILAVILAAMIPAAGAVTDYFSIYSSWVSASAVQSAMNFTPPFDLPPDELSIFRLGYACGYDSAKNDDVFFALLSDDNADLVQTRSALTVDEGQEIYIVNTETNKFHRAGCSAEKKILPEHRKEIAATIEVILQMGYTPCGICMRDK